MAYFDAASGAPLHSVARQALLASLDEGWADPARLYREGRRARMLLDAAREAAAEAVGCRVDELVFTSSGTRAVHTGIAGALAGRRRVGRHLIVSAVEHSSVLHSAEVHESGGGSVTEVPVDRGGAVDPAAYGDALRADTALACLQSANHEVGTEQPVAAVAGRCREAGVPLLVDAAQSLGWGPVEGDWSLLTASAHKWGGPSGVGLLVVRKGVRFSAQGPVDERESGRAPGFENLPAIVAAAASLRAVRAEAAAEAARLRELTERIRARVPGLVPDVEVVGDPVRRLPGVVTFSCLYVDGEALLHELDREGFSVSSGSSCTSSTLTPSHVLRAMGVLSEGNVRVSLPVGAAEEDVERFLAVLPGAVAGVREKLGAPVSGAVVREADVLVVDSLGKRCPIPVIELAKVIGDVPVGGLVRVLSDDEAARLDIPAWCEMRGQEYVGEEPADKGTAYLIRRVS
ncbi:MULTISPECIES: cysteine desulfurase/sulfurtransferase TusA family protein [Streptomyces]|uniref:Aminotransferase class V-fold PLP-dependent enzyme n=1 Tax=Streptomyces koelreuteriae TaxID=2838015 RepID=A0ABX8FYR0_9ACTN|nr:MULTISPECIES: cysteine desulfurase/sulfurtransferase TusA family protein [Streptomyces]QWB26112.1 aminotransferase class V-fold PLP-dependent enzyme [Streptomyces koelreuteriae]UUA09188.1 cysteine desulfurase/sulfurtransferase TusA family protein [Streptomyces koelreuteriae]UUA16793.1 cysteine desulfurase/sulfurtransferase TusA family protein [Streptomyces sp. CRCS-T-1]